MLMEATIVVDTSMTLSTMYASLLRSIVVSMEARTILIFGGKRCTNNCLKEIDSAAVPSSSLRCCCIRWSNSVGLLSLSTSPLISCYFRCSEAAVRLTNSALRTSYGLSVGGFSRRSRTSMAST